MKTKINGVISFLLTFAMVLPFVLQTAADSVVVSDKICSVTAETTVATVCKPGYYKTNCKLNMRNKPSLSGNYLCFISEGKTVKIDSVVKEVDANKNVYYWGKTSYSSSSGLFTGYVRLDNLTPCSLPSLTADDLNGDLNVNWTVIDVSSHQKEACIDWTELKNSGVKGVILRIGGRGYGSKGIIYSDDVFLNHYLNAVAAGLHVGCYFYSYAMTAEQAVEEADFTLDLIREYGIDFDMPIFIDIEDHPDDEFRKHETIAGRAGCTAVGKAFCEEIEKAGYYSGIYCNLYFAKNYVDESAFTGHAKWIAQYNTKCTYSGLNLDMWQYTDSGKLSGFCLSDGNGTLYKNSLGYLDIDHCYTNFPKLIAQWKLQQQETTTAEESTTLKITFETVSEPTTSEETTTAKISTEETTTAISTATEWTVNKRTVKTVITKQPTCTTNGVEKTYINNIYSGWTIVEKAHSEGKECILQNLDSIEVGKKLTEDDIAAAMHSDSSYFETALAKIRKENGYTVSYCPDCLEVLSFNYYYKSACNHTNTVSTQIIAATCTKDGVQQTKCAGCLEVLSKSIIPKGHTKGVKTLISDVDTPYTTTKCTVCNKTIAKRILEVGDLDYTGTVSIKDARNILRISIGIKESTALAIKLCDTDGDNVLTVTDARIALRKATKRE